MQRLNSAPQDTKFISQDFQYPSEAIDQDLPSVDHEWSTSDETSAEVSARLWETINAGNTSQIYVELKPVRPPGSTVHGR